MECSGECSSNSESGFCEWELDERRGEGNGRKWEEGNSDVESKRRVRGAQEQEERGEGSARRIWRQAASTQDWTL